MMTSAFLAAMILGQAAQPTLPTVVSRIGFGSCLHQDRAQTVWDGVLGYRPDVFVFLGDNIYASQEGDDIAEMYRRQAAQPGFQLLLQRTPVLATWDDHDFGKNDAGVEWTGKTLANQLFDEFWKIPAEERAVPGVYARRMLGPEGKRIQVILLDTRYFRSPLKREGDRYVAVTDAGVTMLGEAQWAWLEGVLREPADLRIVASSVQVVPEDHRFEKWANFPAERQRLFDLVKTTGAEGVIFVSGDRHLAEISMTDGGVGYPLYDLTASAMNMSRTDWRMQEPNRWRVGTMNYGNNFGTIEVDWSQADPEIRLQIRDERGAVVVQQALRRSWLKPGRING